MSELHNRCVVIDGLVIAKWDQSILENMQKGGITAANCTVAVWEDFTGTVNNISRMRELIRTSGDVASLIRTTKDIRQAKHDRRTGVIIGFQNGYPFEDNLGYIETFHDLGVRVVQLCYNTQNLIGTGCYERDSGLTDFGREVVAEMNRVGILVDLSHVGAKTSEEAILASSKPVCYSHCLPAGLKNHPRNKSDEQLRFIVDRGGFVGVTMFTPFLKKGTSATIDDYVEAIEYVINIVGEDGVGIGTDFTQGQDQAFFDWITHDKGKYRRLTEFGEIINPTGLRALEEFPNLTKALERARWPISRIEKIMGENWIRVLDEVWNVHGEN